MSSLADDFYRDLKERLEVLGWSVSFDEGLPYTVPSEDAQLWVAHSRGIDRLRFAPETVMTLALKTALDEKGLSADEIGIHPLHYQLSLDDESALQYLSINQPTKAQKPALPSR